MALFAAKGGLSQAALKKLLYDGPIIPKHDRPSHLTGDHDADFASSHEHSFFEWFDLFTEMANRQMSSEPWRFQEKSETVLRKSFDGPLYGRRYDIFHNQLQVGLIEISADLVYKFAPDDPNVDTEIVLTNVRLLPFHAVLRLLNGLALWLAVDDTEQVPIKVKMQNLAAMTECLWDNLEHYSTEYDPVWTELSVHWDGKATNYIHWRSEFGGKHESE